jgi:DNA-binding transcriptional LysR family regulator
MNLEQLHYIIEVAKTRSLSAAANHLHISQPAISQSIKSLEMELGVKLFARSRLGAIPTREGKVVIRKALEALGKLQEMKDDIMQWSEKQQVELHIASLPSSMSFMIETVSNFRKDFPHVTIRINEGSSEEILEAVRVNKIDIGLIATNQTTINQSTGIIFEPMWEGKLVLAVWNNSSLASKKRINPEEMLRQSFALYDDSYVLELVHQFEEKYGPLSIFFISNNINAILTAVVENLAVTIGHDFSFIGNPSYANGKLRLLEIGDVDQERALFGWVRTETNKNAAIANIFIQRFLRQFQISTIR